MTRDFATAVEVIRTPCGRAVEVQECYDAWERVHHPMEYVRRQAREVRMTQQTRDVLERLGYIKDTT